MTFEEDLKKWDRYFESTRQIGHTYSAMNGVLNTKRAKLVCAFEIHRKLFPNNKTVSLGTD